MKNSPVPPFDDAGRVAGIQGTWGKDHQSPRQCAQYRGRDNEQEPRSVVQSSPFVPRQNDGP
jgi:hypothetical protein